MKGHTDNLFFTALKILCCSYAMCSVTVERRHLSLTQIPDDIPDNVTALNLADNLIAEVNDFPFFPAINNVILDRNRLTEFPNYCPLNKTLKYVHQRKNPVTHIDPGRLSCLQNAKHLAFEFCQLTSIPTVVLPQLGGFAIDFNQFTVLPRFDIIAPNAGYLGMSGNPMSAVSLINGLRYLPLNRYGMFWFGDMGLGDNNHIDHDLLQNMTSLWLLSLGNSAYTKIPDVSACRNTLQVLDMSDNPIIDINVNELVIYTKLRELSCAGCQLTAVPNVCMINNNPPLTMKLENNPFVCDHGSKWMIPTRDAGAATFSTSPCAEPANLKTTNVNDLTLSDLITKEDKVITTQLKTFNHLEFGCKSAMGENRVSSPSRLHCATLCVASEACLGIGYYRNNHTCALLEPVIGTGNGIEPLSFDEFYLVQ